MHATLSSQPLGRRSILHHLVVALHVTMKSMTRDASYILSLHLLVYVLKDVPLLSNVEE